MLSRLTYLFIATPLLVIVLFSPLSASTTKRTSWSPGEYGATGDGRAMDTQALQQAIDAAHAAGGGTVNVGPGTYLTGTLELRSGVTLHLAAGAILLGSPSIADYRRSHWPALIKARGQTNITITGGGVIDGQGKLVARDSVRIFESGNYLGFFPGLKPGEKISTTNGTGQTVWIDPHAMQLEGTLLQRVAPRSWVDLSTWRVDEFVRPQILEFWQCREVRVSGITLKNAANWVQTYRDCDDVTISGIRVESTSYWNNDGLDLVNSRRVRIEDCDINAADDGICLKSDPSPEDRLCEDVTIVRCRIRSSASAVKLGTASHVGFRRIHVEDLQVYDTYRSAVALETVDGGVLEDITVRRIRAKNTGNAFFLRIGQRNPAKSPGFLRNVEFSDFDVEVATGKPDAGYEHEGPPLKFSANVMPASLMGLPDRPLENIVLRNITIVAGGGGSRDRAEVPWTKLGAVPEKRGDYPEFSMFGELPAWGLYVRHADGVKFENVTLRLASPDFRPALIADRARQLKFQDLKILSATEAPTVVLDGVSGEMFEQSEWPAGTREPIQRR